MITKLIERNPGKAMILVFTIIITASMFLG